MAIVGLAVAIPLTLLIGGSDDGQAPSGAGLDERFPLNPVVGDSEIDAEYRVPEGWRLDREGGALTVRSPDERVQIGITSPGPAAASEQLLAEALDALRATYAEVQVNPGSGPKVGGLPAKGAVVSAEGEGVELRILVAVTAGRERAYLVEVFTAASAPPRRVAEAQRFLDSLRLRG